ncbi:peptidylprolyl isomerase [Paenibacillus campinasensis]|uniref:Peptidyl-prolyl cis-trans isomerase n=1 Tax=Paenibacillus campinasensis TaxID=66347 RepID=A0ABW9T705_9BACL|nr:peptidylprolyl isomerase [Paenibacillus campinasensis]MUG67910.1 peptidylprolyl isomerase [Paenibacillus campinasensis]
MLKQHKRWMPALMIICAMLLVLAGCGQNQGQAGSGEHAGGNDAAPTEEQTPQEETSQEANVPDPNASHPIVTIEMENGDIITAELYPEVAPNTVNNFISLINQGFYDGTGFHRVIPGFMIQGGDPDGKGTGGPGYGIKGEFRNNNFPNDLKHETGILSMARAIDPDSAGSQFFIMVADAPHLDGDYAAFGKVIEGMEAVQEIVMLERDEMDKPLNMPLMKKVTVDTLGEEYPEPEKVE